MHVIGGLGVFFFPVAIVHLEILIADMSMSLAQDCF